MPCIIACISGHIQAKLSATLDLNNFDRFYACIFVGATRPTIVSKFTIDIKGTWKCIPNRYKTNRFLNYRFY